MRVAFITNIRAPYRILQLQEISQIDQINLTVYYTHNENENRKWEEIENEKFNEIFLKGYKLFKNFGYINSGIVKLVKSNDVIIIGGYEQPTYIALSILCRILKKPYIICFDGISTNRLLKGNENLIKKVIKGMVVKNSSYIFGNGTVSKKYFNEVFKYPVERIYNQYLSVDSKTINQLYKNKDEYRKIYRQKLGIKEDEKVLIYSGRLIELKNVKSVIEALSNLKRYNITFLILGGGELELELKKISERLDVNTIITGFITKQEELFKSYFIGDCLILPSSIYEVWGLVINEAMLAGLPVIVSNICGASLDLVKENENGYVINPKDIDDISNKIEEVFKGNKVERMGKASRDIIGEWTFENSRKSLEKIIKLLS